MKEEKPFIVHFEYPERCRKCRRKWTGMWRISAGVYICVECFKKKEDEDEKED